MLCSRSVFYQPIQQWFLVNMLSPASIFFVFVWEVGRDAGQ